MERFFPSDTPSAQPSPDDGSPTPILPAVNPPLPTRARSPAPCIPSQAPSAKPSPKDLSPTPILPAVIPHRPQPPRAQSPPKHPHGERALKRVRFQPPAHLAAPPRPSADMPLEAPSAPPSNLPQLQPNDTLRLLPDSMYPFCVHTLLPQNCPYCIQASGGGKTSLLQQNPRTTLHQQTLKAGTKASLLPEHRPSNSAPTTESQRQPQAGYGEGPKTPSLPRPKPHQNVQHTKRMSPPQHNPPPNEPTILFTTADPTRPGSTILVRPGTKAGACPHSLLTTKCRSCNQTSWRKRFRTEDYQVAPHLLPLIFQALQCSAPTIDAFASTWNRVCANFWSEAHDALRQNWNLFLPIWANPPFSLLPNVLAKLQTEAAHLVLIVPEWRCQFEPFERLALRKFQLPKGPIFLKRGHDLMPPPNWRVWAFYIRLPSPRQRTSSPNPTITPKPNPVTTCPEPKPHTSPTLNPPLTGRGDIQSSGNVHPHPGPRDAPSSDDDPLITFLLTPQSNHWKYLYSETCESGPASDNPLENVSIWYSFKCNHCGTTIQTRDPTSNLPFTTCPHHKRTGRGNDPLSNGDVEQHPGPEPPLTGRGSALMSHGDIESNPGPEATSPMSNPGPETTSPMEQDTSTPRLSSVLSQPFACPFPDCTWPPTSTRPPLLRHLNAVHISAGLAPDPTWVKSMDCWICRPCRTIQGGKTPCKGAHVQRIAGGFSPHPSIPLTETEPPTTPTVRAILQLRSGTIRHIPMGARASCGKSLGHLLRSLCVLRTWDSLQRLLLFAKWVLQPPPRWGRKHRMGNVRAIINRTTDILDRPLPELWSELNAQQMPRRSNRKRQRQDTLEQYDDVLEGQLQSLIGEGALGKAAKHLVSEGIHDPCDPKVLEILRLLHPQPPNGPTIPDCPTWGTCLEDDPGIRKQTLKTVIQSFPPGSAPGPSGLRPKHLQDILQGDQQGSTALLHGLAMLTESCETGNMPQTAATALCSASLIALKKPTGNRVRPVAVGETLRRVLEKYLMRLPQTQDSARNLQPHQFGLGFQNACEILGRSLQQFIDWSDPPEDWGILQIDLSNAFNAVDRSAVLKGVMGFCPHLLPWAIMSLQCPASLYSPFGELLSAQGVQQGSPLGPLFFTVAIHSIIKRCPANLDWNVWYMDDGTILGRKQTLIDTLNYLVQEFHKIGLETNLSKCTLWGPLTNIPPGAGEPSILASVRHIPWTPESGTCLLGVPIHFPKNPSFLRTHFSKTLETVKNLCANLLHKLRDSQVQLAILRGCYSACKFTFLLRSTAATSCKDILRQADAILRDTFESLLGSPVSDHQWIQCTLSFATGGLGISSPLYQCAPATVAGMATWTEKSMAIRPNNAPTKGLWGAAEAISWLAEQIGPNCHPLSEWLQIGKMSPIEPDHMKQKWWSEKVSVSRRLALLQDAAPRDVVRLRCQTSPTASAWSRAPPSRGLGTKIPRDRYRIMLRWHLGLPILPPSSAGKGCPLCGKAMDIFGDHAVTCNRNNLWRRHFLLQDFLLRLLRAAGFQATREESLGGTDRREADILIQNWDGIKPLALDLTVRHTRAPGLSHSDPERVLLKAEEDKRKGAEPQASITNTSFEPLVLHTWSGVSTSGTSNATLKKVLQRIAENRPGLDRDQTLNDVTEGLSCILFTQIAEQLTNVLTSTEVPVIPACNLPDYVDEFGNEASGLLCNPQIVPQHPTEQPTDNLTARIQASAKPKRTQSPQIQVEIAPQNGAVLSDRPSSTTELLPIHPNLPWNFPDPVAGLPPLQITNLQDRNLFPIDPLLLQTLHQFLIEEGQPFSSLFPFSGT